MEWQIADVEKLFNSANFSAETDLKEHLLDDILPVRNISLDELDSKHKTVAPAAAKRHMERRRPLREVSAGDVLNNDRQVLPRRM